jgi:hypothetical protein
MQLHHSLIQLYSQPIKPSKPSLSSLLIDTKSALRQLKDNFPVIWEAYKRSGKPASLVSPTQAQSLRSDFPSKSLLKCLILEVGTVLKCFVQSEGQIGRGKRQWSAGELEGLVGEIEAVDRVKKQRLREDIREACRKLYSKE